MARFVRSSTASVGPCPSRWRGRARHRSCRRRCRPPRCTRPARGHGAGLYIGSASASPMAFFLSACVGTLVLRFERPRRELTTGCLGSMAHRMAVGMSHEATTSRMSASLPSITMPCPYTRTRPASAYRHACGHPLAMRRGYIVSSELSSFSKHPCTHTNVYTHVDTHFGKRIYAHAHVRVCTHVCTHIYAHVHFPFLLFLGRSGTSLGYGTSPALGSRRSQRFYFWRL